MNVVRLELKQIAGNKADKQLAELRYWLPGQTQYKSRKLALAEIAELYDFIDQDFSTRNLSLLQLGRQFIDRCGNISARKIADYSSRGAI
jgi:hypothetical protein